MKPIFSVITFNDLSDIYRKDGSSYKWRGSRFVGFFYEKDSAVEVIKTNACDIHEDGYYPYALVEEAYEGLYGINPNVKPEDGHIWFKWDSELGGYKQIERRPEDLERIRQFTLG